MHAPRARKRVPATTTTTTRFKVEGTEAELASEFQVRLFQEDYSSWNFSSVFFLPAGNLFCTPSFDHFWLCITYKFSLKVDCLSFRNWFSNILLPLSTYTVFVFESLQKNFGLLSRINFFIHVF